MNKNFEIAKVFGLGGLVFAIGSAIAIIRMALIEVGTYQFVIAGKQDLAGNVYRMNWNQYKIGFSLALISLLLILSSLIFAIKGYLNKKN